MRYFSKLPQKTFTSTVGDFTICDFFTRYEIDFALAETQNTLLDNSHHLIELSQNIYEDNNSMWLILLANKAIDPFDLTSQDPSLYNREYENKITTGLKGILIASPAVVVGETSIITEYSGTTYGNKWEYTSVGNFDLNGPFTIVESTDYYTGKVVVKESINGTVIDLNGPTGSDSLAVISASEVGGTYTQLSEEITTISKVSTPEDIAVVEVADEGIAIQVGETQSYPEIPFAQPNPPSTNTGDVTTITNLQYVIDENKYLKVFLPGKLSSIINNLVTFK